MLSVAQALEFLLAAASASMAQGAAAASGMVETVPTLDAGGRVLAEAQVSTMNVPFMDNTQMDGYAVRAADCAEGNARLRVTQRIPAGQVGQFVQRGTAARIFTGAMIPPGADAVVMQEQCEAEGDMVRVKHIPQVGEWVRRAGEDIRAGGTILEAGARLRPQELGLAASIGLATLPVRHRLKVALFFTGDELTMPGEAPEGGLAPGAVYNSNRFTLRGLLQNLGCEITDLGNVPDTLDATRAALRLAAHGNDLVITSGGVSVGEEDHIRPAVEAEGRLDLWQIAVKPGKPLAFGEIRRGAPDSGNANPGAAPDAFAGPGPVAGPDASPNTSSAFFLGLPGNPVSSFVTFLLFVRPFILTLQGVRPDEAAAQPMGFALRADFSWPKADRRHEFLRARVNPVGGLDLFPNQGSGVLTSCTWADGLVDNPPGQTIAPGDTVRFLPFCGLLA